MTVPRRTRHQNLTADLEAGKKSPAEASEPYDPPEPEDQWPPSRPAYLIVVDQLRGWRPTEPPSLAELLETRPGRARDPEPDVEAEP